MISLAVFTDAWLEREVYEPNIGAMPTIGFDTLNVKIVLLSTFLKRYLCGQI